jgi:tetratricopeptide (TPR) repeat protein
MRLSSLRLAILLGLFTSPLALAANTDPVLAKADQLLKQRQPQEAYNLLAPLEDERSGQPDYDYLYGLAALETGKAGVAAFAFERCLATDPRNGPCRVMMARTHMAMGEHKSARAELEAVQASNPPTEVQNLVAQYMGTVSKLEAREKHRVGFYAQAGGGYDSNVTSTATDTQIAAPGIGAIIPLAPGATKQEDLFLQAEAGASLEHSTSPAWTLLADASIATRAYDDVDSFSSLAVNGGFGAAWRQGPDTILAKVQLQDYQLDSDPFRSLYGIVGQYQHAYSDDAAVSAFGHIAHLDNHIAGSDDSDRYTVGGGYSRALNSAVVVYGSLYAGQELADTFDFQSQTFYGLRLGGSQGVREDLRLTASLSLEQRDFDDVNPFFQETREDTALDLSLGAIWKVGPKLSVRPAYTYTNSESSVVVSDYDRHVVAIDLRYEM